MGISLMILLEELCSVGTDPFRVGPLIQLHE